MIRRLRLKNFRRYEDETFEFPEGATFIEGENNAGKTSILYAIEYAFFGNVAQFKSPGALLRPKTKAGGVELDFEGLDGKHYRLQRIHAKPPRARTKVTGHYTLIELLDAATPDDATDGAPTDEGAKGTEPSGRYLLSSDFQDHEEKLALKIAELLGISKRMFEVAISTRQSETARILSGSPKLDIVLGITAVALAEEEFRSMALQREKQCKTLPVIEESLQRTEGELEKSQSRAANLTEELRTLESHHKKLVQQQQAIAKAKSEMQKLKSAIASLDELVEESHSVVYSHRALDEQHREFLKEHGDGDALRKQLAKSSKASTKLDKQIQKETETVQALRSELREVDQKIGDLAGRIQRRTQLASDATACETCGQPIDPQRSQQELAGWQSDHQALSDKQEELQKRIQEAEGAIDEARDDAQRHKEQGAEIERLLEELQAMLARLENLARQTSESAPAITTACQAATDAARGFQNVSDNLSLGFSVDAPADPREQPAAELLANLRDPASKAATAIEVKSAQCEAELESDAAMLARHEADQNQWKDAHASLARESARLQQEVEALQAAQEQAATLRLCSKAFQELQERLREQAAESLATNTLALHQELSHSDEFTKLTIDPSNYAVQVKARDYDQFAPAAVFQGGGHRVLLGLAFKLAIAQMVGHCPFLLLDEPTDGLDEEHRRQLMERLGSIEVTRQMLVITHQGTEQEGGHRIRIQRDKKTSRQAN